MKHRILLIALTLITFSCSNNDDDNNGGQNNCDFETIISEEQFENAPSDQVVINSLNIENGCLEISFSASGCSGNTWEVKLIDSESVFLSNPPQRNLRLSLKNEELCDAFFTRVLSFDITNLQVDSDGVLLNITNSDGSILYEY